MSRNLLDKAAIIAVLDGASEPLSETGMSCCAALINTPMERINWALKSLVYEGEIVKTGHPITCGECGHQTSRELRYALATKE